MAVGLGAVVVILGAVLLQKDQRRSGTNFAPFGSFVAVLGAGQSACQEAELLPADTSAVRATIGSYGRPGPRLQISFDGPGGRLLSSGSLSAGWRQGVVQIPIRHVSTDTADVRVCLHDLGPGSITIAGAVPDPGYEMQIATHTVEGRLRYDYMRPGRESWLELLPTIVHHSTFAKAGFLRRWAWLAALMLMLVAVGLAARTVAGSERA
jgi:hypothetical protein